MGNTIGPYEIRGELGRGAMAVVWHGYDPKLEREVAIKEPVVAHGTSDALAEELANRFIREGRAAAQLSHPGIVTVFAADIYDDRPVIVMEIIQGQTLSALLACGPMTPAAAVSVADQLLQAVGYAHERGVVHRDIKPDNVFVTDDGRVKLADFGLAHVGSGTALTQAGTVMGTPGYMAPEQITGQQVDGRADLFAIGVVLHECLTGQNPFGVGDFDTHATTLIYRVVHDEAPALPPEVFASVPPQVPAVIRRALEKEPGSRFSDADEFGAALRGELVMPSARKRWLFTRGPSRSGAGRTSTRRAVAIGGAVIAVVLGVSGLVLLTAQAPDEAAAAFVEGVRNGDDATAAEMLDVAAFGDGLREADTDAKLHTYLESLLPEDAESAGDLELDRGGRARVALPGKSEGHIELTRSGLEWIVTEVEYVKHTTRTEDVPAGSDVVEDKRLPTDFSLVLAQGSSGKKRISVSEVIRNGEGQGKEDGASTVTSPPSPRRTLKGTGSWASENRPWTILVGTKKNEYEVTNPRTTFRVSEKPIYVQAKISWTGRASIDVIMVSPTGQVLYGGNPGNEVGGRSDQNWMWTWPDGAFNKAGTWTIIFTSNDRPAGTTTVEVQ